MSDAVVSEQHLSGGVSGGADSERARTVRGLRELLPPGSTVFTKLNHVSRSGMTRSIEVMVFRDNQPVNITGRVAEVLDYKIHSKHYGLKVGGCGMDMGFHVVYGLSGALYRGVGYECLNDAEGNGKCPSSYHVNSRPSDWTNKGEPVHHDGYALSQRWV